MCRHTFPFRKNEAIVTPSIITFPPDPKRELIDFIWNLFWVLSHITKGGVDDLFCSPPQEGHGDASHLMWCLWHHCAPIRVTTQLVSWKLCLTLRKVDFFKGQPEANILIPSQLKHAQTSNCPRQDEKLTFLVLYLTWADYNLLRAAQALCLLSFVTWPLCYGFKQKCAMAQCTPTAQFSISALPWPTFIILEVFKE